MDINIKIDGSNQQRQRQGGRQQSPRRLKRWLHQGGSTIAGRVGLYITIIAGQAFIFCWSRQLNFLLIALAVPAGALLGAALLLLENALGYLKSRLLTVMGRQLTEFCLFFAYLLGYLFCATLLVSFPLGLFMERYWQMAATARDYELFIDNLILILAVIGWLRNLRSPIPSWSNES